MEETGQAKQIFILSGQSNMSGRGGVKARTWDGLLPPECLPRPSIHRLSADYKWEEAREPVHADIDAGKTCGVGPALPFAATLLDVGIAAVGLVPCAVGGTAIAEWDRGGVLYEEMVRRARAAAIDGEIRAVLWYQGESDSIDGHDASAYGSKLERLIINLREDLDAPLLPFIQVALASGNEEHIEEVRKAQMGIQLQNVICVDAKGLPLNEDGLHLSTEAQVVLGNLLAQAYLAHFLN